MLIDAMYNGLISAGLPCLLLAFAVWYLNKRGDATATIAAKAAQDALDSANNAAKEARLTQLQFIQTLNAEREDRLSSLEAKSEECEKDRFSLREQLIELLKQDRTVVRALQVPIPGEKNDLHSVTTSTQKVPTHSTH